MTLGYESYLLSQPTGHYMNSLNKISPNHYAKYTIEPFEFIVANELDYCQGNILKYIMRYQDKNGTEDLYKAQWYLNKLIAKSINKDK